MRSGIGDGFDSLSPEDLSRGAYEGVLLKSDDGQGEQQGQHYKYKYWVDPQGNKICWMVLGKGLYITWGDDSEYWKWTEEGEPCYRGPKNVLIAELKRICGLEIRGTCKTTTLSPKTTYGIDITVKMRPQSQGWEAPVSLSLTLPDGHKQERVEYLGVLEKDKWLDIRIGTFETTPRTVGELSFSLTQTGGHWKSGLLVKGVRLTPLG